MDFFTNLAKTEYLNLEFDAIFLRFWHSVRCKVYAVLVGRQP